MNDTSTINNTMTFSTGANQSINATSSISGDTIYAANSSNGSAIYGDHTGSGSGYGIYGKGATSSDYGVVGYNISSGVGVYGYSNSGDALYVAGTGYVSGKFGIGTTTPQGPLHVEETSAAAVGGALLLQNGAAVQAGATGNSTEIWFGADSGAAYPSGGNAKIVAQEAGSSSYGTSLQFWTAPGGGSLTEQMIISPTGYVGIGTSTPNSLLHVEGTPLSNYTEPLSNETNAITVMNAHAMLAPPRT